MQQSSTLEYAAPLFERKADLVRPMLPGFGELAEDVRGLLRSGMVTKGQHLRALEAAVAEHHSLCMHCAGGEAASTIYKISSLGAASPIPGSASAPPAGDEF
jgi:hypothetical protein